MALFNKQITRAINTLFTLFVLGCLLYWCYILGMMLHKKALGIYEIEARISVIEAKFKHIETKEVVKE